MVGRTIGHYRVGEELGRGGMGVVYRGEDTRLGREVAIKFLPESAARDLSARERFIREARSAAAANHPNICGVHDIGETDDGHLYIVMPLYDGETMESVAASGPADLATVLRLLGQVCDGLAQAHARGIVHRDIKPSNVLVTSDLMAVILDFGVSKLAAAGTITASGSALGTFAYMAPEQVRGDPVDSRADLWSVGVVLYELLVGRRPFESEFQQALAYMVLNEHPVPPRHIRPGIPEEIERIILECLEKDPADRPQLAEVLAASLRSELSTSSLPRLPSWAAHRLPLFATLVGAITVFAALLFVHDALLWLLPIIAVVSAGVALLSPGATWRMALFIGLGGVVGFFVHLVIRIQTGSASGNLLPFALAFVGMISIAGSLVGAYLGVAGAAILRRYPRLKPWVVCSLAGSAVVVLGGQLFGESNDELVIGFSLLGVSSVAAFAAWRYPQKVWRWAVASVALLPTLEPVQRLADGESIMVSLVHALLTTPLVALVYGGPALVAASITSRLARKTGRGGRKVITAAPRR